MKNLRNFIYVISLALVLPLFVHAAPVIDSMYPEDNTEGGISYDEFYINFTEPIVAGAGNITLKKMSDNSVVETIDIDDAEVDEDDGIGYIYWESEADLEYGTEYYFNMDAGIVTDESLDPFEGILDNTTWNFTTRPPLATPRYTFERISVNDIGEEGDDESQLVVGASQSGLLISADGTYVAFYSKADNFTETVITADSALFVRNRTEGSTVLVSGTEEGFSRVGGIAEDGSSIFFDNDNEIPASVFMYDVGAELTTNITTDGDASSDVKGISRNGQYVGLLSSATNLVPGDVNGQLDMFIYDVVGEEFSRIGDAIASVQNIEISSDGQKVLFTSLASGLVGGDTNGVFDVFLYDQDLESFERVSVDSDEEEGNAHSGTEGNYGYAMSEDARYVVFVSTATNLTPDSVSGLKALFLRDRQEGTTTLISDRADNPVMTPDGKYIVYRYSGEEGEEAISGIYRYDTEEDETLFITEGADSGGEGGAFAGTQATSVSADGSLIVFDTNAINLVEDDTNGVNDVFLWDENAQEVEDDEEEPEEEEEEGANEGSGRNGSSGGPRGTPKHLTPDAPLSQEELVREIQLKLLDLLQQLLALLKAQQ